MILLPDTNATTLTRLPEKGLMTATSEMDVPHLSEQSFASFLDDLNDVESKEVTIEDTNEDVEGDPILATNEVQGEPPEENLEPMMSTPIVALQGTPTIDVQDQDRQTQQAIVPINDSDRNPNPFDNAGLPHQGLFADDNAHLPGPRVVGDDKNVVATITENQTKLQTPVTATRAEHAPMPIAATGTNLDKADLHGDSGFLALQKSGLPSEFTSKNQHVATQQIPEQFPKITAPATEIIAREGAAPLRQTLTFAEKAPVSEPKAIVPNAADTKANIVSGFAPVSNSDISQIHNASERVEVHAVAPAAKSEPTPQAQFGFPVLAPVTTKIQEGPVEPLMKDFLQETAPLSAIKSEAIQLNTLTTTQNPVLKMLPPGNAQAIADAVLTLRDSGGKIDVSLSPEELGRLTIKLDHTPQGNHFTLSAERGDVQELIRRQIEALQNEFRSMGFENATFAFEQQNDAQDDPENMHSNRSGIQISTSEEIVEKRQFAPKSGLDIRI